MRISRLGSCFPRGEEFGGTKVEQSRGGFEFSLGFVHGINAIGSPPALGSLPTRKNPNYPEYRSTSAGAFYDPELIRCKNPEKKPNPTTKKNPWKDKAGTGKRRFPDFFLLGGRNSPKIEGLGGNILIFQRGLRRQGKLGAVLG